MYGCLKTDNTGISRLMSLCIDVQDLYKQFNDTLVVDKVSLKLNKGEVLGFLGPNGAGKSTTMRMITGYLEPSDGSISICGKDMASDPIEAKRHIGYLPEGSPLYSDMSTKQLLRFVARVRGLSGKQLTERVNWVVDTLHLQTVLNKSLETLSKGFKRRVGLAQALIHDPDVLVLDEPTDGLDPIQKQEVRELIKKISVNKAIIISTHILEEVEPVCSRAVIISKGQMVFDGKPEELLLKSPAFNQVSLKIQCSDPDSASYSLRSLPGVSTVSYTPEENGYHQFQVSPKSGEHLEAAIGDLCFQQQWKVVGLHTNQVKLEDVFQQLAASQDN